MVRRTLLAALAAVIAIAIFLWIGSQPDVASLARPQLQANAGEASRGAAAFAGAGFGGLSMDALETNAIPWRLVAAALVLDERSRDPATPLDQTTLTRILARFGFLTPERIANLPEGMVLPKDDMPLGITYGDIAPVGGAVVRVANLGCAACHAGVTYGSDGRPIYSTAMLGTPNTSLDLEAYTLAIFSALRRNGNSPDLVPAAEALFPQMGWRERLSLRYLVLPLARQRMAALADVERPMAFTNGAPGSTNGVAALKAALGTPLAGGGLQDAGVVSIPDLGDRIWRSGLLVDGVYAVPGTREGAPTTSSPDAGRLRSLAAITTFFTVPSMGVHPDKAQGHLDDAIAIMAFLRERRPQRFPGPVNTVRAAMGQAIYGRDCASCHGRYDDSLTQPRLVSFPNWQGDVGTDQLRAQVFDKPLADAVTRSSYRDLIAIRRGQGYAATPLTGLWASAPYLHNGSVPTLAALLSPNERPRRFMVGGHALDFERVGIALQPDGAYPAGYAPFSQPAWIDVATPGRGNAGHTYGEGLTPEEKLQLIEYLKLL